MNPTLRSRLIYASAIAAVCLASACGGGSYDARPACNGATPEQALAAVNAARAQARYCGAKLFAAAPPLALSGSLVVAATAMATDRAIVGDAGHISQDGATHTERARRAGYTGWAVGENTAAGTADLAATVDAFLASEGHCINIMWPHHKDFGAACSNGVAPYFAYWAHEFGTGAS